jgi:CubicO group peptidase (beta-lactamase class C family)
MNLDSVVAHGIDALGIPGVAIGVSERGTRRAWCGGVTHVDHPLPITDTTIFQIGSISKTFVGTAVMALVDAGRLDLDTPVVRYVPDLRLSSPELTAALTTRHLLTHVAGWVGDYFGDTGMGDDALARFVAKLAKAPQLTPLGEVYSYNNTAFNLAAHVVATVREQPYEQAVRDMILRPLGLRHTFFSAEEAISHRVAIGHRGRAAQRWGRSRGYAGAGGVLSCVTDMLAFAEFHMGDGAPVMSTEALRVMQEPSRDAGCFSDWIGLVWRVDDHPGGRVVHHGGTTNGYMADLRLVPSLQLAWVVLTNGDSNHQLDPIVMEEILGPDTSLVPHDPSSPAAYVGRYSAVLADLSVEVAGDEVTLVVSTPARALWNPTDTPPPPVSTRLQFIDDDRFVCLTPPCTGQRGEFLRDPDGSVAWVRWDGRIHRRVSP